ncbi:MAG: hypothetical protein C0465_17875 [Ralstonia sp.]|uniref:ABC transporter substrate-binding protein n=1 Tax=Ralstonia sp. TaxID=54061 RepID=UPI00257C8301|nr:ABC transporter substrate-binding protein [Ralstonia sp.]MBA4232470.1 hypothetical protein [Ralstonia sp.]
MQRRGVIVLLVAAGAAAVFAWNRSPGRAPALPVASDTIAIRFELAAVNFDARTVVDVESKKLQTLLHSGLVGVHQDGRVEPRLASSWKQVAPDRVQFTLRNGVQFSDGTPADAKAAVASLCEGLSPTIFWSFALDMIERKTSADGKSVECTGITSPSADVVEIKTAGPTPAHFFEVLDSPAGWILKAGEKPGEFGRRAGIGPYTVSKVTAGQDIEFVARTDGAAVVAPRVKRIVARFIQDPALAARSFSTGSIDLLRLDNPQLYDALVEVGAGGARSVRGGELISHPFARLRTLIVNEPALTKRGLSPEQIASVRDTLSSRIDRERIAQQAPGKAQPRWASFPPMEEAMGASFRSPAIAPPATPKIDLALLVNNDPYSDLVASRLPKQIGNMTLTYRAVDFGAIIAAFQKGEGDLIGLSLDATVNSPSFYLSFWRPGSPLTLFGKGLPEVVGLDVGNTDDLRTAARVIQTKGNWIPLYADEGLIAKKTSVDGLRLTRSGQESLETIGHKK